MPPMGTDLEKGGPFHSFFSQASLPMAPRVPETTEEIAGPGGHRVPGLKLSWGTPDP